MVADMKELEKFGRVRNPCSRTQCNEKLSKIPYSRSQMEQSSCLEEIRFSKDPLEFGTTLHERAQRCSSRGIGRVSTIGQTDDNEARHDFFGRRELHLSSSL